MQNLSKLSEHLKSKNHIILEGCIEQIPEQITMLQTYTNNPNITKILEIGFNAGHSSCILLDNPKNTVVSFDLGHHRYTADGKMFVDDFYPGRHTLIIGDSTKSIPTFSRLNKDILFDLIFVDGGHTYEIALADIKNCKEFAHHDTIVIVDDVTFTNELVMPWSDGPTKAWINCKENGEVIELEYKEISKGRGWVIGKYNFE